MDGSELAAFGHWLGMVADRLRILEQHLGQQESELAREAAQGLTVVVEELGIAHEELRAQTEELAAAQPRASNKPGAIQFEGLRRYARSHHVRIKDLAADIVTAPSRPNTSSAPTNNPCRHPNGPTTTNPCALHVRISSIGQPRPYDSWGLSI